MKNYRSITEGALLLSVFMVLLLFVLYVPLLGSLMLFALPLPFILGTVRQGWKTGVFMLIAAMFLSVAVGLILVLPLAFLFASSGIVVGVMIAKKKSAFAVLLSGSLAYIANSLLIYVFTIVVLDINLVRTLENMMYDTIAIIESTLGDNKAIEMYQEAIPLIKYIIPSTLTLSGIMIAFITQLIATPIVKRFYSYTPQWKPFREWDFPKVFIWYYVGVILLSFLQLEEGSAMFIAVVNLQIMLEFVMIIQGFTLIYALFYVKKVNKGLVIFSTILALVIPPLLPIIKILGIIDLGFDLKTKLKNKHNV